LAFKTRKPRAVCSIAFDNNLDVILFVMLLSLSVICVLFCSKENCYLHFFLLPCFSAIQKEWRSEATLIAINRDIWLWHGCGCGVQPHMMHE
jgi:hypothetical protein